MTTFLRVKNLDKHQHYKDRRPPWIKLHAEVLDDYAFACLQDASKAHLMLLWVLASRMDNRIPNDPTWIARKINATAPVDVAGLVSAGFLEVCDDDGVVVRGASGVLAMREHPAMPETEREAEAKTEKTSSARADARRGGVATLTPSEPAPDLPSEPVRTRPGKRAGSPALYPHYPPTACNALYELWTTRRGPIEYARFRKSTALLFDTPAPRYALPDLEGALKLCLAVVKHQAKTTRRDTEWALLTPERWVGRIVEWVDAYRRTQADPEYLDTLLSAPAAGKVPA